MVEAVSLSERPAPEHLAAQQDELLRQVADLGRASRRRAPLAIVALLAVIAGLVILTVSLQRQVQKTRAETIAATIAREQAERSNEELIRVNAALSASVNESAGVLLSAKQAFDRRNFQALAGLLRTSYEAAEKQAEQLGSGGKVAAIAVAPQAAARPAAAAQTSVAFGQRVFIQFAGLIARSDVRAVNGALREAGWNMQGADGERTGAAAGLNEVRYHGETDLAAARALAAALTAANIGGKAVTVKRLDVIREGTLEAWISRT